MNLVLGAIIAILITICVENLRRPKLQLLIEDPPLNVSYPPGRPAKDVRYLRLKLFNRPLARWMLRAAALQCRGMITFHHLDGQNIFGRTMAVRWSSSPQPVDRHHLAVALTLPAGGFARKGLETNSRHKLLGDSLEALAFAMFAFHSLPTSVVDSGNIADFMASMCSNTQHAALFDHLGLQPVVCHEPNVQLTMQGKADVVKAIVAAVYLSTRDFSRFFDWMTRNLVVWRQHDVARFAKNPLAAKRQQNPKNVLQELLQGQGSYRAEYVNKKSGPEHKQTFSTTLFLVDGNDRQRIGSGVGGSLRESERGAATQALERIIPHGVAGTLTPLATRFWKSYVERLLSNNRGTIIAGCGIEQFRSFDSFVGFVELKAFSTSLPDLSPYLQTREFTRLLLKSIGTLVFASPKQILALARRGIGLDPTGEICARWNERESTWRKSGSCQSRGTNQSRS
jgi:dsRNA-specific ribonuclease